MKLADIKDERALDVIADIIEPLSEISIDEEFKNAYSSGQKIKAVQLAIKNHKKAIIQILAVLNGVQPEEFHFTLISLPVMVMGLLNELNENQEMQLLFRSEDVTKTSFTSASENIEVENE